MTALITDLKRAFRTLRKTPGFTIAALIVLALGIGANTSIFSIVNGVLLRPLPYAQPDRLVQLWHTPPQKQFPGMTEFALSAANYLDWERQNDVFEQSAIYSGRRFRGSAGSEPKQFQAAQVEPTFFSVLRVQPLLGRTIAAGDDQTGHEHVVVLSYKLWQTEFGGDRSLVGKTIQLNDQAYSVVGVMAPEFDKPSWAQLWSPLVWDPAEKAVRGEHHFAAVARLKPGVTLAKAQADLDTISARLAQQYPADDAGWGAKVVPLREETVGEVRKPLLILLGAVAFVLLIACANVANLLLARTLDRRKEIAIRTALGASRAHIIRQVLTEATVLAIAGGALGLLVARSGTDLVIKFFGSSLPRVQEIGLDAGVLAFTFVIAVLTGVIAGLWPAWKMSKSDPNDALKQGLGRAGAGTAGKRTRQVLVTAEVALSLVLLVGAGLMVRTLWNLRNIDPGFEAQHVLTMNVLVSSTAYTTPQQWSAFFDELRAHVRALPGVQAAGFVDTLPLQGGSNQPVAIEGAPAVDMAEQPEVSVRIATPGFMEAMHFSLVRGRLFADSDTATSPEVVIISQAMAKQFWPNEDPIGKHLALTFTSDKMREIVGVVGNTKDNGLSKDPVSILYYPVSQVQPPAPRWGGKFGSFPLQLAVRTSTNPADATAAIRNAIHAVSPSTPILNVKTMEDLVAESISPQRFNMILLACFAGLALLLAAVGIYSVLAYGVRQRIREIGVRMALGAQVQDVLRMILFDGMKPTLVGIAIGFAAAVALSRVLATLVFGVKATDVPTFLTVTVLLVGIGMMASLIPAYRATRVDPLKTLRDE